MVNPSMKVPPKRKGNDKYLAGILARHVPLNESPSEKEGKSFRQRLQSSRFSCPLNESPSEKEGK